MTAITPEAKYRRSGKKEEKKVREQDLKKGPFVKLLFQERHMR